MREFDERPARKSVLLLPEVDVVSMVLESLLRTGAIVETKRLDVRARLADYEEGEEGEESLS